jgi:hypothetical protein
VGGAPPPRTGFACGTYPTSSHSATQLSSAVPLFFSDVIFSLQTVRFRGSFVNAPSTQDALHRARLQAVLRRNGVHPYAARMPRRALFAVSLGLLTLAGCGGQAASGGGDPASAVPADAAMYFDATLRPQGSQREDALAAAGKVLATDDPEARIEQLVQDALSQSDGLKLDYARDVEPWLGAKAGFWLAPTRTGEEARGAAVLATTDADAARSALDRAVKGSGQTFTQRSYKGVDYEVNQEGGAAAVADDFVVLGSEAELKRTLETLDGGKALGSADGYKAAVEPLDADRLGTVYFDLKVLFEAAASQDPAASAQFQQLSRLVPLGSLRPAAAALTAKGDRLAIDAAFRGGKAYRDRLGPVASAGATPLLRELPGDAWFAFGGPKFGASMRNAYQGFAGALGGAAIEQQLQSQLGLDLEQDVFSWIGDVAFFARGTSKDSIDGAAVISVTDEARAKEAFGKLVGVAQSRGRVSARPVSVPGAETAFAFAAPDAPKPIVAARGKGKVVIAYGEAAAADALEPAQKLGDSAAHGAAKEQLGDGHEPAFLVAMPQVVSLIGSAATDKAEFARAKPYLDAFSVIAAGGKLDGDTARSRFVAGLK